jgi:hypothetical protein
MPPFGPARSETRLVPEEGVEPTHSCLYGILSPARLPVPPLRPEAPFYREAANTASERLHTRDRRAGWTVARLLH